MARTETQPAFTSRLLEWLRTPADVVIVGVCFTLAAIPIVTAPWALLALGHALRAQRVDDESRMAVAYWRGLAGTRRAAVPFTAIVLPLLLAFAGLFLLLGIIGTAPAIIAFGVLLVVSTAVVAAVLSVSTAVGAFPELSVRSAAGIGARAALAHPAQPLFAAVVAATLAVAASQMLWVAAAIAISLPVWMLTRWWESNMKENGESDV